MKAFGHPVHMMLIHFPSALWPMDLVCSCLAVYLGNAAFAQAAFFAMAGAAVLGWLAVITGALDIITVLRNKPEAVTRAVIHGSINLCVLLGYSLLAYIAWKQYPLIQLDGTAKIVTKVCLNLVMLVGNYMGANLILKDRVVYENESADAAGN